MFQGQVRGTLARELGGIRQGGLNVGFLIPFAKKAPPTRPNQTVGATSCVSDFRAKLADEHDLP
jgi:hypothetical protein